MVTYNRINGSAYVRRAVMLKFGKDMRHYWPLNEPVVVHNDLARGKALVMFNDAQLSHPGMIDGAVQTLRKGYLSSSVPDLGSDLVSGSDGTTWQAIDLPVGTWEGLTLNKSSSGGSVDVYVSNGYIDPTDVPGLAVITKLGQGSAAAQGDDFTVSFPFPIATHGVQFRVYLEMKSGMTLGKHGGAHQNAAYFWTGSVWQSAHQLYSIFRGEDAVTWPLINDFTVGVIVNVDSSSGDGAVVAISDANEVKFRLLIKGDKTVEGYSLNTNSSSRTVTAPDVLQSGFNIITLSYEKGVTSRLGVNGQIVASGSVTNFGLFNGLMYVGVGAEFNKAGFPFYFPYRFGDKRPTRRLVGSIICEVWMADTIISDLELLELYKSYVSDIPFLYQEKSIRGGFPYRFPATLG